jgi:uncharacterized protein with von Willebrand factor type A (vWA) domain
MDKRIVEFIQALRTQGVRVSLAESKDAFEAIDHLGSQDREVFRITLLATLVKNSDDIPRFNELFPLFFQANSPQFENPDEEMTYQDARLIADALRQFTEHLRRTLQKLMQGHPLTPDELSQLDRLVNMDEATEMRHQSWKLRQMEQALRFNEVKKAIEELVRMLEEMGMDPAILERLQEQVQSNQTAMREQLKQHIGQKILDNMLRQSPQERADNLYNRPFNSLTDQDMHLLRKEVTRLAATLRTRLALRLKRARGGQLDVKGTLRTNLKYGAVPLEIRHRDHTLKPKIVVLCDISTSMRHVSELMLSLLFAIQDQISKTHAFSFIDRLEYISPYFDHHLPQQAISDILQKMPSGHYNTDLGFCLQNLQHEYLSTLDHHSTFIIVGDARNNYNDPRLETFRNLANRSRSTIWLNPEAPPLWGSGDSDMLKYMPFCSKAFQVNNLTQLADAIDHLLVS